MKRLALLWLLNRRLRAVRKAAERHDREIARLEAFVNWWPQRYLGQLRR